MISGHGSNMEAILKAIKEKKIPANPAVVISNRPDAKGLQIAKNLGVKTEIVDSQNFKGDRLEYDKKIIAVLEKYNVIPENGLVCLAGFMRIISPEFIKKYKNRIMNIHPALLPAYPGLHAQRQALEDGAKYSGCTVHFADEKVDHGPIILQATVEVKENDTEETLSERILEQEHKIYPEAVRLFALGKIKLEEKQN